MVGGRWESYRDILCTIITLDTLHYRGKIMVKTYSQLTNLDGLDFVNSNCLENSFLSRDFLNKQVDSLINEIIIGYILLIEILFSKYSEWTAVLEQEAKQKSSTKMLSWLLFLGQILIDISL